MDIESSRMSDQHLLPDAAETRSLGDASLREETVSPVTFEELRNDPFERRLIEHLEERWGSPLSEDIQQFLIDLALGSQLRVDQENSWISTASAIAGRIVDGRAHEAEYPLFWIRLHAIAKEYCPKYTRQREAREQVGQGAILNAIDALLAELSEDDLTFIAFVRHSHCHMHVDYVRYDGKAQPGAAPRIVPPSNPEAEGIARRILEAHEMNQQETARTYALKVSDSLHRLSEAVSAASEE